MAVVAPDISVSQAEADRQKQIEDQRLREVRDQDLARIFAQFGDLKTLALVQEAMRAAGDDEALKNLGLVQDADQRLRYSEQERSELEGRLSTAIAKRQGEQVRADDAARTKRMTDAESGVNSQFAQYNDGYFDNYARGIVGAQLPSLQDVFRDRRRLGNADLSDRGIRKSSAANRFRARIAGEQADAEGELASNAANEAQTLRVAIESRRNATLQAALAAAGIKQSVPIYGGSVSDILDAIRASKKPQTPGPEGTPAPPAPTPPPRKFGGPDDTYRPVLRPEDGGPQPVNQNPPEEEVWFDSNPTGGQIAGVDEWGNWVYAHRGVRPTTPVNTVNPAPTLGNYNDNHLDNGQAPVAPVMFAPGMSAAGHVAPQGGGAGGDPQPMSMSVIPPAIASQPGGANLALGPEDQAMQEKQMQERSAQAQQKKQAEASGGDEQKGDGNAGINLATIGLPTPNNAAVRANANVSPMPLPPKPPADQDLYDPMGFFNRSMVA